MKILSSKEYKRLKVIERLSGEVLRIHDEKVKECMKLREKIAGMFLELLGLKKLVGEMEAKSEPKEMYDRVVDSGIKRDENGDLTV